jgi:D-glycero-alpha-D-manno-heptose-7-phosphate kinase
MIITRTPLRISIGGGGTDLPSYYEKHGGFVISAAISKYVYILLNQIHRPQFLLKYSRVEEVESRQRIVHPLFREALEMLDIAPGLEIVSVADVMAGTGLGSSGAFTVGLLHALYASTRQLVSAEILAQRAVEIEMKRLGEPVGKQDQYIAAYGGLTCQEYRPDGSVAVSPLDISETTRRELADGLMLFFTGATRNASELLLDQKTRSERNDAAMTENLHHIKDIAMRIMDVLKKGRTEDFGRLMDEHWRHKRERSVGMSDPRIDHAYEHGKANGALGGKLVGAGGGGFLMFFTTDRIALRRAMAELDLIEMPFSFDFAGSIIQLHG